MYDLILTGGTVYDGTRRKPYRANICIAGGRIARITPETATGSCVVDVTGLAVAPGFIDIHTHADTAPFADRFPESKVAQGVTTEINGNCGSSIFPATGKNIAPSLRYAQDRSAPAFFESITDYAAAAKATPIRFGCLVGHSALRLSVMGFDLRQPTPEEMDALKALLDRELTRGALGLSLGLIYPPSAFSATEELVELAKVVARHKGILSVHMRNEGPKVFEAVDEVLDIARRSGVHLEISHLKLQGVPQWGKAEALLDKIRAARSEGLRVTCDQYPFCASSTGLKALVPHWAHEGGADALMARLKAKEGDIPEKILENIALRGGEDAIRVPRSVDGQLRYIPLPQVREELGLDTVDTVVRLLLESKCTLQALYFNMSQEDMLTIMSQDFICVGSDGSSNYMQGVLKHPRNFATFPRFWETMRQHRLMPYEDAVWKMSGLPATVLGLKDRGMLLEGYDADITVFDPESFSSPSSYDTPAMPAQGLHYVIVGGQIVWKGNALTNARPGGVLLHK